MAGLNPSISRAQRRAQERENARQSGPRLLLSWEDWLTLAAAALVFLSLAFAVQAAEMVRDMPSIIPTTLIGLVTGLLAARIRVPQLLIHPVILVFGTGVVLLGAQPYAEGATVVERLGDFRMRVEEWFHIVRAGDISNDNLPFVTLVQGLAFLVSYVGTWAIYRWHNAWIAILPVGVLLLVTTSVVSGQPSTAFVFYLFGALVLLARMHLQKRQAAWRREGVEYPEFMSLSVAQLTIVLAAGLMAIAWMVPLGTQARAVEQTVNFVGRPFSDYTDHFVRIFHNLNLRGSGDFYSYGESLPVRGEIDLGTKTLYEVKGIENLDEIQALRAASYDEYTGVGWLATARDEERFEGGEIQVGQEGVYRERAFRSIEVTIRDNDDVVLFRGTPFGTNLQSLVEFGDETPGDIEIVRTRRGLNEGDTYNALGTVSVASSNQLRRAGTEYPEWVSERYLQLPESLPDRVRAEANRITATAASPYDATIAIEDYFRDFPFDFNVPAAPPGRDTVDYFINELGRGHFLYTASGMAVMLRTQGIPARIAIGYALDPERVEGDPPYRIRREDAYAWVEVFFPEYGWVDFNPTGNRPEGGASELPEIDPSLLGPGGHYDPFLLDELFIDPTGVTALPPEVEGPLTAEPVAGPEPFPWWIVWTFAGTLLAAGAIVTVGYASWNWGLGTMPPHVRLWAKVQRLSGWAGMRSPAEETPREWSRRMGERTGEEGAAKTLVSAYEEARYGRPERQRANDDKAQNAYKSLRGALIRTIMRRRRRDDG